MRNYGLSHYEQRVARIRAARRLHLFYTIVGFALAVAVMVMAISMAHARDGDNHGNHGALKSWFDQLASKRGLCCSFADGVTIASDDWDIRDDGHYIVRIPATDNFPGSKDYLLVPDEAVITEPNRFGQAVVWPYFDGAGNIQIRCFIPGAAS